MLTFNIPLTGLSCMGCARKSRKKALLEQHQAVITDLSPTHVQIETDSSYQEISETINNLNYQAGYQYQLFLSGLSCGKCVTKLSSRLEQEHLVGQFELTKETLNIETALSIDELQTIISEVGYSSHLKQPVQPAPRSNKANQPLAPARIRIRLSTRLIY
ncbi:hypothetical protein QW180_14495 [Vibrio sinaloensis]|nr:hypothetical protein [Vibrio sinaloensis]